MQAISPTETYKAQLQAHNQELLRLQQKRSRLRWARFAVFIATAIVAYTVFVDAGLWGLLPLSIGLIGLIVLVFIDADNNRSITHIKTLIQINEEEVAVLNHQYTRRYNGSEYAPAEHAYANDLDLFGAASLFQYINRCASEDGRSRLAQNLLEPLPLSHLTERQEAVKELAPLLEWRQELQAIATQMPVTAKTRTQITGWLAMENTAYTHTFWSWFVPFYSLLTIASLAATLFGVISVSLFFTLFGGYYIFSLLLSRNVMSAYTHLSGVVKEVSTLEDILHCVEERKFTSSLLVRLQERMQVNKAPAAQQIKNLKGILDRFDVRLNVFVLIFLNSLLLWDVRQVRQLNAWRLRNRSAVPYWFELLTEIEVLNSLSTLHFNQPLWCFPTFPPTHFTLIGTAIAHPLIPPAQRVSNDFHWKGNLA